MKFYELFLGYEFDEVINILLENYPDEDVNYEGYKKAHAELLYSTTPVDNDFIIKVESITVEDEDAYVNVSAYDKDGERYALDFFEWGNVLGANYNPEDDEFTNQEVIAHVLWEITFNGYSNEDVQIKQKFIEQFSKVIGEALDKVQREFSIDVDDTSEAK